MPPSDQHFFRVRLGFWHHEAVWLKSRGRPFVATRDKTIAAIFTEETATKLIEDITSTHEHAKIEPATFEEWIQQEEAAHG